MTNHTTTDPLNEPQAKPPIVSLLFKTIQTLIIGVFTLLLWPLYIIARFIWYRPPNVPHWSQVKRYLHLTWTVQPPAPGLSPQGRYWLTLSIIRQFLMTPLMGLAWLLDELLYGRALNATDVVAPLFVISGGRSGSTQMTRYIETDPSVTAPSLLQCMFPYLWLWRLAPHTIGKIFPPEKVRERLETMMPPELLERHEFDPFGADTFDGAFWSSHLNHLAFYLGPAVSSEEFNFAVFASYNQEQMARDFVQLVDRIGCKQRLFIGDADAETPRRFFIKGHFLYGAEALARHYPDAVFLTLIRDPAARLQSGINYLRVNPSDPAMGPPPWAWLAASLRQTESGYCRVEQAWYSQKDDTRRCVVRFAEFIDDLEGTMQRVYEACLDQAQLPPHVPRTHPPRERKDYTVNYSLAELGIDADALRTELAEYVAWCQPARD
ncbi:MAG: sulfotransferase [Chloroflexota bacterium]